MRVSSHQVMIVVCLIAAATIASRGEAYAWDWSRFRGADGLGVSEATGLPLTWSPSENIAWKTPLPGAGASSPIVFGDHIYLTAYSGYLVPDQPGGSLEQLKRHLIAVNREDGAIAWEQAIAAKGPEESKIRDHGYAASTPVADKDHVYVFFGKSGVFAFDHSGKQVWTADVGTRTNGWGSAASPVLYRDLVIVNASVESQSLVAIDRMNGKEKWRATGIRESWNTPVLVKSESGRQELVIAVRGQVLGIHPETGKQLWSCQTDIGWYMVPSVVAVDGVVYCLGGRSGTAALAVKAGGSGDVTASHRLWTSTNGANVSSPVFWEGHLYWANEARGVAYCAESANGNVVYQEKLNRAGQIYASALLADGRLYYLTRDGRTFVLAVGSKFEQLAVNELRDGGVFNGSPAVDGQRLLIRSDKFLYCIGK